MYTLHEAITLGDEDMVRTVIRQGAGVNLMSHKSVSPLIHAICCRQPANIIQALIDEGADVNMAYGGDLTPLMCAVGKQDIDVINLLLVNGADPNAMGLIQDTVLSHAVFKRNLEIIRLLVEAGADINAKRRGGTALSFAQDCSNHSECYSEVVYLLKALGAKS